jgi:hypothetical protein
LIAPHFNKMNFLKKDKTNWKYILIVVILAAIVGGGILWYIKKQEVPPIELSEIKKPERIEDETVNWNTYYNPQVDFTFKYPKNYEFKKHYFYLSGKNKWNLKIVLGKIGEDNTDNFINFDLFKNLDCIQGTCIDNFHTLSKDPQILEIFRKIANSKRDDKFAYWSQWCAEFKNTKGSKFTIDALKNIKYSCYHCKNGQPLQFEEGKYYESPDPTRPTGYWYVGIWQPLEEKGVVFGDLNNDGKEDAALILDAYGGGSGHFYELAIVINHNGIPCYLTSEDLGDRVIINSITLASGVITLDMIVHGPEDALCCPSAKKIFKYKLSDNQLIKVE